MGINLEEIEDGIKGRWELIVDIPKILDSGKPRKLSHPEVIFRVGKLVQLDPIAETIERDSLEAIGRESGELLCRISLDEYKPTGQGFEAIGIGHDVETNANDKRKKTKNEKIESVPYSDPYYGGSPATQFWHAVRMSD